MKKYSSVVSGYDRNCPKIDQFGFSTQSFFGIVITVDPVCPDLSVLIFIFYDKG